MFSNRNPKAQQFDVLSMYYIIVTDITVYILSLFYIMHKTGWTIWILLPKDIMLCRISTNQPLSSQRSYKWVNNIISIPARNLCGIGVLVGIILGCLALICNGVLGGIVLGRLALICNHVLGWIVLGCVALIIPITHNIDYKLLIYTHIFALDKC